MLVNFKVRQAEKDICLLCVDFLLIFNVDISMN